MSEQGPIVAVTHRDNTTIVSIMVQDILDQGEVERLCETVDGLVLENPTGNLILDFSDVRGLCSSAIGYLVALKRRIDDYRGRLIICCVDNKVQNTPHDRFVYEIFKVVKLDTYFELAPSVDTALRKLKPATP